MNTNVPGVNSGQELLPTQGMQVRSLAGTNIARDTPATKPAGNN